MRIKLLDSYSDKIKFTILSTAFAFIVGLIGYSIPITAEHINFHISAPLATILPSYFVWKKVFKTKSDYKISSLIAVGLILTLITHYLNFVILGIGRLICYQFTGNCTDYTGEVESLLGTLTYFSFLRALITLYKVGIITWFLFITAGIYVKRTSKLNDKNK